MSYATIPVTPKHQFSGERLPSPPVAKLDSLSKEHRLNLYFKAFQKQDPHHSGRISVWGLKNALSELGIKPTAVTLFNIVDVRKEAESLFSFCDFTEFVTIIGDIDASEEEHKSSVRRAYNMLVESAELAVQQKSAGIRKASAESAVGEAAQKTPTAKVVTGDETMPFKIPHPSTYSLRETIEALGLPFDPDNQMIEFGNPDSLSFEEFYSIVSREAELSKAKEESEKTATRTVTEHLVQSASGSAEVESSPAKQETDSSIPAEELHSKENADQDESEGQSEEDVDSNELKKNE